DNTAILKLPSRTDRRHTMNKDTWHIREGFCETEDGQYRIVRAMKRWKVYMLANDVITVSASCSVITGEYVDMAESPDGNWKKPPADGFGTLKEAKQYVEDQIAWFDHLSTVDQQREQYERDTGFRKPR